MDAAAARPASPVSTQGSSPSSTTLETQLDSLLETFKRGAARAMLEQQPSPPNHESGDTTVGDVPGRLLRFRLPSARRLPFNLSLKRSRSGVSALSSAEESPPSDSSSSSGTSPACPLGVTRGGNAPHRRSLPGLLEASSSHSPAVTPTHHNNSASTADLAVATTELTKAEQDMYLMGVTMASLTNPEETCRRKERQRLRAQYVFQGKKVCLDAFLYLENCTHYQLKRIRKHVMTHGVTPRVHGNHGKSPHNTFSLDIYKHAILFLENFIEPYTPSAAVNKPSKTKSKKVIINLPPKITRKNIHNLYKEYCQNMEPPIKVMGYSSFRHFISEQFPHVRFSKPDKIGMLIKDPHIIDKNLEEAHYDSDLQEDSPGPSAHTTIPLVMTSTQPDPNPTTFSSGGNTYVITQVLPSGFVPVNSQNNFQGMTITEQTDVNMPATSSMASSTQNVSSTYTFATNLV